MTGGPGRADVLNPANDALVATVPTARIADADRALAAARDAFVMWSRSSIAERQMWMHKLRACMHHEMGKPWGSTQDDFDSLKNSLEFYAEEIARVHDTSIADMAGTHSHRMLHEAAGVALAYLAWNFQLLNLAFKIGPAMATGSPIIIRPSEQTPISAYAVGELCHQIGLPAGNVQILCTDGYDVADHLSASPIPVLVTLIGSNKACFDNQWTRPFANPSILMGDT